MLRYVPPSERGWPHHKARICWESAWVRWHIRGRGGPVEAFKLLRADAAESQVLDRMREGGGRNAG